MKRLDLVQTILDLKGEVNVDANIYMLSDQISKLTETIEKIASENNKLQSDLVITQNVGTGYKRSNTFRKKNKQTGNSIGQGTTYN